MQLFGSLSCGFGVGANDAVTKRTAVACEGAASLPNISRRLSCGKPMLKSDSKSRARAVLSKASGGFGKGMRAWSRGVTAKWQTEQMRGCGRSRAKNCLRWQLRHEAGSGCRVTSGKAASGLRASFQPGEGKRG